MILNQQKVVRLRRTQLEKFLKRVQKELGVVDRDVTVCFVSDGEIAEMNERFRKKSGPTDVLSFRQEHSPFATRHSPPYLGDIAIAPETARRYAKKNGRTLENELRVLILHGVLHLLGYDHETDRGEMHRFEQKLRRNFGLV